MQIRILIGQIKKIDDNIVLVNELGPDHVRLRQNSFISSKDLIDKRVQIKGVMGRDDVGMVFIASSILILKDKSPLKHNIINNNNH